MRLNNSDEIIKYAIETHYKAGNKYGEHEYDYHLNMVYIVANYYFKMFKFTAEEKQILKSVCFCHDLEEDAEVTREELRRKIGEEAEEIVWCVSGFGHNRKERNNDAFTKTSKNKKAKFAKLCDRIANVKNSKYSNKNLFKMYKKEHTEFRRWLYVKGEYDIIWKDLDNLFN